MLLRLSSTLYTCADPAALVETLEAKGWRRQRRGAAHEVARLSQGAAVIVVYENSEVVAHGAAAREALHTLWARNS